MAGDFLVLAAQLMEIKSKMILPPAEEEKEEEKEEDEQSFAGIMEEEEEKGEAVDVEELDEAEFYVQQGLVEEAKRIYENYLKKKPGDPAIAAKLNELEQLAKKPVVAEKEIPIPPREEAPPPPKRGAHWSCQAHLRRACCKAHPCSY
jgi:chromatin segregation and condensation protein Rec8/ScpA/Scc1 (kleisin family)